jgi:hypothetical protein
MTKKPSKTAKPNHTPGNVDKDDPTADASKADLDKAANIGADPKNPASEAISAEGAGDLDQDPREPYPTGNPPDPRETYHSIHGVYPPDEDEDGGSPNVAG